jgi:RES domain-containing protein
MPEARPPRAAWRITTARWGHRMFDGEGARLYGGRWNPRGIPVVYASETLSLAALEYFVHLEPELAPPGLLCAAAEIPSGLRSQTLAPAELPAGWREYPAGEPLQELGAAWVREGRSAVLYVPSAVIPHERNVLLNPAHPDFRRLRLRPPEPFSFDPRMWK